MKNKSRIVYLLIGVIAFGAFFELGLWQLHRAQEVTRLSKPLPDGATVELSSIAAPAANLKDQAINRIVAATGNYVGVYTAPNQEIPVAGKKQTSTLEVGLLKLKGTNSAILVVRGIVGSFKGPVPTSMGEVAIVGRLVPHQNSDHWNSTATELGRIDPALIAGTKGLSLFDGYIIARTETAAGVEVIATRVESPRVKSGVPGFYWQHISYVFIWWFMALLVIGAPMYSRYERRKSGR
ncbi:MAG: SURF1 family cytochrome oxidase biogenesis protein [Actinomycetes bacterium]